MSKDINQIFKLNNSTDINQVTRLISEQFNKNNPIRYNGLNKNHTHFKFTDIKTNKIYEHPINTINNNT